MRKFIFAIAILLATLFVISRFTEMQNVAATLQRGDWRYLALALCVEAVWIVNMGVSYRNILQILGIDEDLSNLIHLSSAANFFSVIAPSGGMSGMVVFVAEARKRGYSSARATVSQALYVLFDYAGFLIVLALGLVILFQHNHLSWPEIVASIILIAISAGLAGLLFLGTYSAELLARVLTRLAHLANRILWPFIHRPYLSEDRAVSFAHDAADGVSELRRNPRAMLMPLALALSNKALMISVLFLVFLSFRVPFSVETLVAGFSMGYLFFIVSPTPSGIGVVEGVLTLSLRTLGVPIDAAAVVALAYRGFTFWVPFIYGMACFRSMGRRRLINRRGIN